MTQLSGIRYRPGVRRSQTTAQGVDYSSATRKIAPAALLLARRGLYAPAITPRKRRNGMDVSIRINEGSVDAETYALEPHGELDMATARDLAAALDAAVGARRLVVVDLGDVRFLDASSLGLMVAAHRRLVEYGGRLVIVCSDPRLVRIFEITGLVEVLSVTSSRREALSQARPFATTA